MQIRSLECISSDGHVAQVFDKALTETTFCQLYSQLCHDLSNALPDFEDPDGTLSQDGKPMRITFRRILLNKCQVEFEKGTSAKAAVETREKAAAQAGVCSPSLLTSGSLFVTAMLAPR